MNAKTLSQTTLVFICFIWLAVFSFAKEVQTLVGFQEGLLAPHLVWAYLIFLMYQADPTFLGLTDLNWLTAIRGRLFDRVPQIRHAQPDFWRGWVFNHP